MELEQLLKAFLAMDDRIQMVVGLNGGLALLTILLRVFLYWGYQFPLLVFRVSKKNIEKKEDIKSTPSFLLNKITKDYLKAAEKGLGNIKTEVIVEKHLKRMHFFGWNLRNIEGFIAGLEKSNILIAGLSVFWIGFLYEDAANRNIYGDWIIITAGISFLVIYLVGRIFSYENPKHKIKLELEEYLDHQYGGIFAQDIVTMITRMQIEMKNSIHQLSNELSESYKDAMHEMMKSTEDTMNKFSSIGSIIEVPLTKWKESLLETKAYQEDIKDVISHFHDSIQGFEKAAGALREQLLSHQQGINKEEAQRRDIIKNIERIIEGTEQLLQQEQTRSEGMRKQIEFIHMNQEMVNISLQKYEEGLENVGKNIGDILGNAAQFQGQKMADIVEQSFNHMIETWMRQNTETVEQFQKSMEKIQFYNQQLSQKLIDLKDDNNDGYSS